MRRSVVVATLTALTLSGCSLGHGLYNVSLPGGADVGSHPLTVTVQVADALDLVPQSAVKVNDVAVGKVTAITLAADRRSADVTVQIRSDVHLPANAVAAIDQTSLLGEKYVALSAPLDAAPEGTLRDHAVIPPSRTSDGVQAEQVLGALSLLLNGGGIGQLHDIAAALNQVAHGNETQLRDVLSTAASVVGQINAHRGAITSALDSMATLSSVLRSENSEIATVLTSLSPGLSVLADEHTQLTEALTALGRLSSVTVATVKASQADVVNDLTALAPILSELADAGASLPESLQALVTYPFTDAAVAGIKGDYLNSWVLTALNTPGGSEQPSSSPASTPPAGLLPSAGASGGS